ncbi:MAG: DUF3419 family protein, partial [Anaerolineae bacterium]|nr:DUF3419 family protein [Anaerolineae bacterium]
ILFEDSDVDWRHFILDPESRVLTIAGAGCGVAAMPASQPASMDVVDSNLAHLSLSALKTLGPRHLSYDDFHQLFGVGRTPRAEMFIASVLRDPHLPEPIQKYWSGRRRPFGRGLYRSGLSNRMTQGLASVCRIDADWICEVAELSADERAARVRHDVLKRLRLPGVRHVASSPLQLLSL